mgnify:CR=1 FL=1
MFHYTVKSRLKLFPTFLLDHCESLEEGSLIEIKGTLYRVFNKICLVIFAPDTTEIVLIVDKP